jgi:hypothetical protein
MRSLFLSCLILLHCPVLASNSEFEIELQRQIKMNKPGDYNGPCLPAIDLSNDALSKKSSKGNNKTQTNEYSESEIKRLFSEAKNHLNNGKIELAELKYKQILLIDPNNREAKVQMQYIYIGTLGDKEAKIRDDEKKAAITNSQTAKDITTSSAKK